MISFGHYCRPFNGIEHKLGYVCQAMCIDSSLHHGQTAFGMHCRRQGDCVRLSPQGIGWHSAEAGEIISSHAH